MKKFFFLSLPILLCSFVSKGQTDTITVNGTKFITVVKTEKNEYDSRDTLLQFYRMENGNPKYLFHHYTYKYGADCNNEFTDIGNYKISNDSLIFTTKFIQKTGLDPIPAIREQVYKVETGGKTKLIYDREYYPFLNEWKNTDYAND